MEYPNNQRNNTIFLNFQRPTSSHIQSEILAINEINQEFHIQEIIRTLPAENMFTEFRRESDFNEVNNFPS
jgi:hypothetical protein